MNISNRIIIFIIYYPFAANSLTINPQSISLKPGATQFFLVTGNAGKLLIQKYIGSCDQKW
jgi:hypothetical protein